VIEFSAAASHLGSVPAMTRVVNGALSARRAEQNKRRLAAGGAR
jgi:hypothetical protein